MNIDRIDTVLENQRKYIQRYRKSLLGKVFPLVQQETTAGCDEYEVNKKYIRSINTLPFKNFLRAAKQKACWVKFRIKQIGKIKIPRINNSQKDILSIACIIKNEGRYIKEWVDFHFAAGVDRIYIFDNDSSDNTRNILDPYIKSGAIIYIFYPGKSAQLNAYYDACRIAKHRTKWLALIDADEFLFPVQDNNLKDALSVYESFPAVGVNWVVFGPDGHEVRPQQPVTASYLSTFADKHNEMNCRIKSIVQPGRVAAVVSPHNCIYKHCGLAVDENGEEIVGEALFVSNSMSCTANNSTNILRINHYWTKSLEDLREKCQRGYPDGTANPVYEKIRKRLDFPMKKDDVILRYIDRVNSGQNS